MHVKGVRHEVKEHPQEGSLRSRFGVVCVRVTARLSGETGLKLNGQTGFDTPLDRKSDDFLLLLLLFMDRGEKIIQVN